ncbi:resolvase-like protein [Amycolatopsis sulphurea]|uniref:Resolvase-like protein n=1 Tax=Amycolatopsis sulphurea TaxID=76022 RepID=A0A2A9FDL5_9PSEU|nr:recombinase family protein [Amycolatopsis sulphurea]PFG49454.1 resolvase-like protein [Amycolatopsis sulphurea]
MADNSYPDLCDLRDRLATLPLPKLAASKPPAVYGYVRTAVFDMAYADGCTDLLRDWSQREGWRLGGVFRDLGVLGSVLERPGFTGLLDVLRLPDSTAALVLTNRHLSDSNSVAAHLTQTIRRTGATLRVLADVIEANGVCEP